MSATFWNMRRRSMLDAAAKAADKPVAAEAAGPAGRAKAIKKADGSNKAKVETKK